MKRPIIIIIIILLLLAGGAWFYFSRVSAPAPAAQTLTNTLPFGNGAGTASSGTSGGTSGLGVSSTTASGAPIAHLFKLSDAPVAGAVAFVNKAGSLDVRYVDRATGHMYDIDPTSLAKTEIINVTVPKVYDAVWKPDGSAVILRTLEADGETIDSSSVSLMPPSGTSTSDLYSEKVSTLPAGISEISAGTKDIFYSLENLPQIVSALFDGSKAATVWSAPFTEWQITAAGDASMLLVAKPSASVPGYAYALSAKGTLTKLLGPADGLSAASNSSLSRLIYSFNTSGGVVLSAERVSDGATRTIVPATLADKCVWSHVSASVLYCGVPASGLSSSEPDAWYQGISHYSDQLWQFDVDTDYAAIVVDPKRDYNVDIDAEKLFLSPAEDYLFFINRSDLSLWALKLN